MISWSPEDSEGLISLISFFWWCALDFIISQFGLCCQSFKANKKISRNNFLVFHFTISFLFCWIRSWALSMLTHLWKYFQCLSFQSSDHSTHISSFKKFHLCQDFLLAYFDLISILMKALIISSPRFSSTSFSSCSTEVSSPRAS